MQMAPSAVDGILEEFTDDLLTRFSGRELRNIGGLSGGGAGI
jgi:hypothetical protein